MIVTCAACPVRLIPHNSVVSGIKSNTTLILLQYVNDSVFSSWSFGVVLWEIFTLGGSPYPGITTDEFLTYLKSKRRMEKPDYCPDEFYQLMVDCWQDEPESRPAFSKLFELITDIIENLADTVGV